MNSSLALLAAIIGVPIVVMMVLRINAALVFLSLCLGDVLVQFVAGDTSSFMSLFSAHAAKAHPTNTTIQLFLLLLPVVLTAVFMIRTVKGPKLLLNILPAAGVGLLGALLVVPLLPTETAVNILSSNVWHQVKNAQDLIVGLSALFCLLVLWLQRPTAGEGKHGKKHHS